MTVAEIARGFVQHCIKKGLGESTVFSHSHLLDLIVLPAVGNKDVEHLLPIDADLLLERAIPRGVSVPQRSIVTYRRLLKYAVDCGYKLKFDWREIEVPRYLPMQEARYLTPIEIEDLRHVVSSSPTEISVRDRALVELVLHTGLRISEAISVNREDLDFENNELRIKNVKTKETQTVFLHGAEKWLKEYLDQRTDDHEALFIAGRDFGRGGSKNKRFSKNGAKSLMRRIKLKVRFKKPIGWHVLRKTYCTHLLLSGVDIKSVQYLARHKSERTTLRHYIAVSEKRCKEAHKTVMASL